MNTKQIAYKKRFIPILIVLGFGLLAGGLLSCGAEPQKTEQASVKQLWTCGMHPQVIQDKPGNCPICGMKLVPLKTEAQTTEMGSEQQPHSAAEHAAMTTAGPAQTEQEQKGKKILYWRAPMDPTYISDKPGKSPMGMDLIPVFEGEEAAGEGPTVKIDPVTVQNIGVRTAIVEVKRLDKTIRTVGHVDYDEEKLARINLKFSGWIEKLYVDETGQSVRKGQPLLEIYSPELVATQEEYLLAYKNAQKLKDSPFAEVSRSGDDLLEASRRRLLLWDIDEKQIRELEQTGKVTKTMQLRSPVTGYVINKMAEEGMRVMPGMDLYHLAGLTTVWVYAHLFEYEIPWIRLGDEAQVDLPYIPGKVFTGRVKYIYPYLDNKARDVKVRLEFPNPDLELKPQMYANVVFKQKVAEATPIVPDEAVLRTGRRNLVFIALGGGKFEPREVVLGNEGEENQLQVLNGLHGGEEIVTSAQFLFDSESRLQEAIQKMIEAKKMGK